MAVAVGVCVRCISWLGVWQPEGNFQASVLSFHNRFWTLNSGHRPVWQVSLLVDPFCQLDVFYLWDLSGNSTFHIWSSQVSMVLSSMDGWLRGCLSSVLRRTYDADGCRLEIFIQGALQMHFVPGACNLRLQIQEGARTGLIPMVLVSSFFFWFWGYN